uniref:TRAP transporter small permease subunit n=1 Tax=Polynucleobacter sp. TaxID=2029855 RepID=UPI004047A1E4
MLGYIKWVDGFSKAIGHAFAWTVVLLTLGTCYEVFMRYVLNNPTDWAFDMSYMFYGTLFMMAGPYTLSKGAMVRGDFLYRVWKETTQAKVDLALYFLFYFPGILALVIVGGAYGFDAMMIGEVSVNSPVGVPVWPLKIVIFFAGVGLFLAGTAEVCRCLICIKTGIWPFRDLDVKELEEVLIETHSTQVERT